MGQEKRFIKGLFKDTAHIDQPEGSWRHARNMILNSTDGAVSNEGGTELSGNLGNNPITGSQRDKVIGKIEVDKDRVVLFVLDVVTVADPSIPKFPRSEIGIWENGVYTILFNPTLTAPGGKLSNDLNFKETNPIEGTFKIDSKGDLVVYWTDDLNPPRAFNVDRHLRDGSITSLYGITSLDLENIDILNLFPYSGPVPHIYIHDIYWKTPAFQKSIIEGGGLLTGVYYLALAYVDDDLVATNYLTVSNPVSIVDEFDHTRPTSKKDGARDGSQTSKAIKWRVDNINTDYKYLRPVIIRKMGDATDAYKLNLSEISLDSNGNQDIIFSGLEGSSPASVDEIIIDTTSYEKAKTINQLDGVLYLGNLKGTKDVGYQKYANNIKLKAKTKVFENFDEFYATMDNLESGFGQADVDYFDGNVQSVDESKSYRYIPNITNWKGYQRDEVYAFYIAFILNDGSMSYAYHIPGREKVQIQKTIDNVSVFEGEPLTGADTSNIPTNAFTGSVIYDDLQRLSKAYARNYHFFDFSDLSGARDMNYWENSTELYPNTDNYEVWDKDGQLTTGTDGSIQGANVRHHHFPSNANSDFMSVVEQDTCETVPTNPNIVVGSQPIGTAAYPISFQYVVKDGAGTAGTSHTEHIVPLWEDENFHKMQFPEIDTTFTSTPAQQAVASALFDGTTFTATQPLIVTMSTTILFGATNMTPIETNMVDFTITHYNSSGVSQGYLNFNWGNVITGPYFVDISSPCPTSTAGGHIMKVFNHSVSGGNMSNIAMDTGDYINIKARGKGGYGAIKKIGQMGSLSCTNTNSVLRFTVHSSVGTINPDWLQDAKISHTVKALGFSLDDVQIPQSIADKVQGFKIYYAKREHSDKRILGQSVTIPMQPEIAKIGLCKEAWEYSTPGDGQQIMSTLQEDPVTILRKSPWATWDTYYPKYDIYVGNNNTINVYGHKSFSFPDFNLLRTKNSISGATHIKPEYRVQNFVWNGSTLKQDKKMISKIILDVGSPAYTEPIKKVVEEWGYEKNLNCWGKEVDSAVFIGKKYEKFRTTLSGPPTTFAIPRVIGQKAKSYLKGDSIFNAEALGFGGTVLNDGGESSFIFSLKDKHELLTLGQSLSSSSSGFDAYGKYTDSNPFYLVGEPGPNGRNRRSTIHICNLHAFKTDVYKSIDTQELVWTGFEVLGQDIQNFIFDDTNPAAGVPLNFDYKDPSGTVTTYDANFSIETLQKDIQKDNGGNQINSSQYHIFGGDTFICRYGMISKLTGMDSKAKARIQKGIHYQIVETSDNINFRHSESDESLFFPGTSAKSVLKSTGDLTKQDNIKYNSNYSALNDIRPAFPLPSNIDIQDDFPTRTHRSAKNDTTSLIDNYRIFLANQFKDLPKNRGELWKLSAFNNLLYFHMEDSLFASKGKQSMSMKDGSEAFVGSGDIFKQDPEEIIQTEDGFAGTQSQYAALTTRHGYFFVDRKSRKVFLMKDKLSEISSLGLSTWFELNLGYALEAYEFNPACSNDNPIIGFGLTSVWDPKHKRIILTKRDLEPTAAFITGWNMPNVIPYQAGTIRFSQSLCKYRMYFPCFATSGQTCDPWTTLEWDDDTYFKKEGWTISYYPELGVWGSFHDYTPYIYFNTSLDFYSLTDKYPRPCVGIVDGTLMGNAGIYKHDSGRRGILYQQYSGTYDSMGILEYHPFEFEFIHNETKTQDSLLSSFNYTTEVFNSAGVNILEHGFTKFFLYNTFQLSGESNLEYLINTRRVGNNWKINHFRDMAALVNQFGALSTSGAPPLPNTSSYYMSTNTNIIGGINTGTITTSSIQPMFTVNGMSKVLNNGYLDLNKSWEQKRKFIDKWVGIRLIYDNISNNLLNLYSTNVVVRKMHR